ncbi:hypothetical protein D3C84_513540 [compost metagenome]
MRPRTAIGKSRKASSSVNSERPRKRLDVSGRRHSAALASLATGWLPLPIMPSAGMALTLQPSPSTWASAGRKRSAWARISACGRVNRRRLGKRSASRSGFRYKPNTASRAARVILSTRSARLSGFFLILAINSLRPTINPACGPPSSLSPLKVTMSAPSSRASRTVGSAGKPQRVKSSRLPLPRSSSNGSPCWWAICASSAVATLVVKP